MMDEQEKQRVIAEALAKDAEKRKRELSERMRALGKKRSPKKRAAVINNLKAAHEARFGRPYGYKKKKDTK